MLCRFYKSIRLIARKKNIWKITTPRVWENVKILRSRVVIEQIMNRKIAEKKLKLCLNSLCRSRALRTINFKTWYHVKKLHSKEIVHLRPPLLSIYFNVKRIRSARKHLKVINFKMKILRYVYIILRFQIFIRYILAKLVNNLY